MCCLLAHGSTHAWSLVCLGTGSTGSRDGRCYVSGPRQCLLLVLDLSAELLDLSVSWCWRSPSSLDPRSEPSDVWIHELSEIGLVADLGSLIAIWGH